MPMSYGLPERGIVLRSLAMPQQPDRRFGPTVFGLSLVGLGVLPWVPDLQLLITNRSDLKIELPILYYEAIISFLLVAPALLLPGMLSRLWTILATLVLAIPTAILSFYAASSGARWNLTAQTAL